MATVNVSGPIISIETDRLLAQVHTEGYVSGIKGGTLVDKASGACDLGHGLDIVDFLLEPKWDDPSDGPCEHPYHHGDALHGDLPKRYVEGPQVCTQAKRLDFEVIEGDGFVAVRQWYRWEWANYGNTPGSLWEQTIVFADGLRYFLSADRVTSVNTVDELILRIDLPGHLKHSAGAEFAQMYMSYEGYVPSSEFVEDWAPDARFLYERDDDAIPERMIRGYQVRPEDKPVAWLLGMPLEPSDVFQAWCHQRGYVCHIMEIGGRRVQAGESFGAAYAIGWFDDIPQAEATYDEMRGARGLVLEADGWGLTAEL